MSRILIAALSCRAYEARRQRCFDTWVPEALNQGMDVLFLIGEEPGPARREGQLLFLPCQDDYGSLSQKVGQFYQWALEHSDFEYIFKCDDDTYLRADRLAAFDTASRDYIGAEWFQGVGMGSGGAGYWLSRRAVSIVVEDLRHRQPHSAEDVMVGQALREAGIQFHNDRRFIPFGSDDLRPTPSNDVITTHACEMPWKAHRTEFLGQLPVVTCSPLGRLGNNLFQVAAVLGYAARNGTHVPVFADGSFGHYRQMVFRRLTFGDIPKECLSVTDAPDFSYNAQIPASPNCSVRIDGYMQSEKYFEHCRDLIRETFAISDETRADLMFRFGQILESQPVSLHVRRGDYLRLQEYHPVQTVEYYAAALKFISEQVNVTSVLCFSDDPAWCIEHLASLDPRIKIVEQQDDYLDLALMTLCSHHIISNSTFSWWGAWLCENRDKIVVAPQRHFGPAYAHWTERDLIPSSWIRMGAEVPQVVPRECRHVNTGISHAEIHSLVGKDDPVVLELGSNDGEDSARFLAEFPGIQLHCFEPDPRPLARFTINDPRCTLHALAIAAEDGVVEFHLSGGTPPNNRMSDWDLSSSIRPPTGHLAVHPWCTFDRTCRVPARSLDSWFQEHAEIEVIDFIWADIQGAEVDLIRGGAETLRNHVRYLYTEFYDSPMYDGQISRQEILKLLPEFDCIGIFEGYNVLLENRNLCRARV